MSLIIHGRGGLYATVIENCLADVDFFEKGDLREITVVDS